jgi:hypothetical protein
MHTNGIQQQSARTLKIISTFRFIQAPVHTGVLERQLKISTYSEGQPDYFKRQMTIAC